MVQNDLIEQSHQQSKSNKNPNNWSNTSGSNNPSNKTSNTPKPYSNLLGPDGKLKPEEKERRKKEGLCLVCGGKHDTDKCPKRKVAQGRAAQTDNSGPKTAATPSVAVPAPKESGK